MTAQQAAADAQLFRDLLVTLARAESSAWQRYGDRYLALREYVANRHYLPLDEYTLEAFFKQGENGFHGQLPAAQRGLFLPCLKRGRPVIPVIGARYKWFDPTACWLQAMLFVARDQGEEGCDVIGLRFEPPEQQGSDGTPSVHNYYHMQLCKSFETGGALEGAPPWLPDIYPALPLDARDAIHLPVCLLVSLYGRRFPEELLVDRSDLVGQLRQRSSQMAVVF